MSGFRNPLVGGGGALEYPSIQSPDFSQAGKTGWAILKDGTAYFFSVTAEGTITATQFDGTDFSITDIGALFYSATPAAGNLTESIAPAGGTDSYGNTYVAGLASYQPPIGQSAGWYAQLSSGGLTVADSGSAGYGYGTANYINGDVVDTAAVFRLAATDSASSENTLVDVAAPGGTYPGLVIYGENGAGDVLSAGIVVSGFITYMTTGASPVVETWHDISGDLISGWSVSVARYQLLATGEVICEIVALTPPSTKPTDGTAIWPSGSIPTGWAPAANQYPPITVGYHLGSAGTETPALQARPNGAIECYGFGGTSITRFDVTLRWFLN